VAMSPWILAERIVEGQHTDEFPRAVASARATPSERKPRVANPSMACDSV